MGEKRSSHLLIQRANLKKCFQNRVIIWEVTQPFPQGTFFSWIYHYQDDRNISVKSQILKIDIFFPTGCRFKSSNFSITRRLKWTVWWCRTIASGKNVRTRISGNCFLEQGLFFNYFEKRNIFRKNVNEKVIYYLFLNFLGGCRQSHWGLS